MGNRNGYVPRKYEMTTDRDRDIAKYNLRPALAGGSLPSFLGNGLVVKNRQ